MEANDLHCVANLDSRGMVCRIYVSCVCYAFVSICLYVPCGHLLGKGWPLGSGLWCPTVSSSLSLWYPGSGVVLDCVDSWSLRPYFYLCRGPLDISTNLMFKLWASLFQKIFFLKISHCKSLGAIDPWGVVSLNPRGMIYVGDHWTLLYTLYISCGPHGLGEDFLKFFRAIDPLGRASCDPRGLIGRVSVVDH